MSDTSKFEMHCIVELFGHQRVAGKVSEQAIGGGGFIRVDVPKTSKREAFTKFYGPSAIYAMTPVSEQIAQIMADRLEVEPVSEWQLSQALKNQLPASVAVEDDDDDYDDDDGYLDDSPFVGEMPAPPKPEERRKHTVVKVACYTSNSGNTTWKAWDDDAYLIYLRQSHRDMLTAAGLWDTLNQMQIGDSWEAEFVVHTVLDGDFLKPVEIEPGGFVFTPEAGDDVSGLPDPNIMPDPAISENAVEDVLREDIADHIEGWRDEEDSDGVEQDKRAAAQWARDLLTTEFVIFDTETTGFDAHDEIIQIGVIDQAGEMVLEQLIKPDQTIANSQYHGITDDSVKDSPSFADVYPQIKAAMGDKKVIAYNFAYDRKMLNQVCQKHNLEIIEFGGQACAMEMYAQFNGEWNDYHGNYRWVKLRQALADFGLKHEDFGTKEHDACTDARATLAVIKKMAEYEG